MKFHYWRRRAAILISAVALATGAATALTVADANATAVPPTTEGVWNGTPAGVPAGAQPNVLNDYYYWGNTDFSFLSQAQAKGATPFLELEPWQGGGPSDCQNGLFASIANNSSAAQGYENALGTAIANFGHPVIVTFAHEFNVSGQYPWSVGNGCGVTASQWITAWNHVVANVKAAANGFAFFMWAPNVDPNGNDTVAAQYWPGAANVDMTGVDGYSAFCGCGMTFANIFGGTFSEIKGLPGFSTIPQQKIFIAETDMNQYAASGGYDIPSFVADLCSSANGGDGLLQFQDGLPALTSAQWSALNSSLTNDCPASGGGGGGTAPVVTTTSATNVGSSSATGNGTVNPEGASTTYKFDYGTTTSYGSSTTAASAGSGTTAVNESASLTGLSASTTYHYRIEATNATGTTLGSDQQFTTTSGGGGGGTSVALDSASGSRAANTTSLSWTHTVGTGSNRALLVDVTVGVSSDAGCQLSATYDGIQMSQITVVHTNNQRAGAMAVFGLASNPPSGSDTVHVSATGCAGGTPASLTGGAESFTGVNQAGPWGAHAVNYGNSTLSSVSVTSTSASNLVGEFVASGSQVGTANSPVVNQFTENETNNTEAGNTAGGYAPGAAGTVAGGYNLWQDWWGAAAVDIAHA